MNATTPRLSQIGTPAPREGSCTTRSSTTCLNRAPCGSRPAFTPRVWCYRREHRREAHPTVSCHACRAVSARHQTRTHRPRRCRLGPAIVKSITQAHDGTLTLTPRAAGGLRATVQLPPAPPHPRGVCQRANGLGTGLGDRYRAAQGISRKRSTRAPKGIDPRKTRREAGLLEPSAEDEMVRRRSPARPAALPDATSARLHTYYTGSTGW
jgi:hypothetical protein